MRAVRSRSIEYRVMCVSDPLDACLGAADATILATGPLTSDALAQWLVDKTGSDNLAFFDAAAPVVMADSLDMDVLFRQSRYEQDAPGDYLNAPFDKESYDAFIAQLVAADRVIKRDFETKDLFQACQPIEEIARKGADAPRFGTCKPVGLTDPATGRRPWAAVQLRAENAQGTAYNLVGFQTNLTFGEQKRVFRLIPGLENAEFFRPRVCSIAICACAASTPPCMLPASFLAPRAIAKLLRRALCAHYSCMPSSKACRPRFCLWKPRLARCSITPPTPQRKTISPCM